MPQVIVVDVGKCVGCHSCEMACAIAHSEAEVLADAIRQEPLPRPGVIVVAVGEAAVPLQCRHCEEAPCVQVCPRDALQRPDPEGPVLVDHELCTGCQACVIVCPFGMITMSSDGKSVIKCDLCIERLDRGEQPACVEACPTGSLQLLDSAEPAAQEQHKAVEVIMTAPVQQGASGAGDMSAGDTEGADGRCTLCGELVARPARIKRLAGDLGVDAEQLCICRRCRRARYSQLLCKSEAMGNPAAGRGEA